MGTRPQNSECTYPTVTVYGNPVATKNFPTKMLLKMVDSSVKSLGELEYDNQNSLQHLKIQVRQKNFNWGLPLLPLHKNRSRTKKFPIEILLEMIDSDSPRVFMLESIISKSVSIGNFLLWTDLCTVTVGGKPHFEFFGQTWVYWSCSQFCFSYSASPRFLR